MSFASVRSVRQLSSCRGIRSSAPVARRGALLSLVVMGLVAGLGATSGFAQTVNATFASAATVPVTAAGYTATGQTVNLALGYAPATGTSLTVVNNTGLGFISGTFSNLAQGQAVDLAFGGVTYSFVANYYGGTGNDLVLQWAGTFPAAWGLNDLGQLGLGTLTDDAYTDRLIPVRVTNTGALSGKTVVSLDAGRRHNLALCSDGTLISWGSNSSGEVGVSFSIFTARTPEDITARGVLAGRRVVAVSAGGSYSLALCSDGTLAAWGVNVSGQLGILSGAISLDSPVAVDTSDGLAGKTVVAVSAGGSHSLALCSDGTLVAWGANAAGQLGDNRAFFFRRVPFAITSSGALAGKAVVAIAAGGSHSLALCSDGTLVAWGANSSGQLGDNSTTQRNTPVAVAGSGALAGKTVVAIAAGGSHSLALCSDGTLVAWGANAAGQLGDNSTTQRNAPVDITGSGALAGKTVVSISAGSSSSLALCSDGTLVAWGANAAGQLGDNSTTQRNTPVAITQNGVLAAGTVVSASAGESHSLALVAPPPPPAFATSAATSVTGTGATLNGTVNPFGVSATVSFSYGLTTNYGTTVTATPSPVTGTSATAVSATLTGLTPGTTYNYRITAVTGNGTFTGINQTFTTLATQSITFANPGTRIFGDGSAPFALSATASSGLPVTFSVVSGPATVSGDTLTLTGTGTVVVRASQSGNSTFAAAPDVDQTFTVNAPAPLVATFTSATTVPASAAGYNATGRTLNLSLQFAPAPGSSLTVVNNTGLGFINGRFTNLAQGQTVSFTFGGVTYSFVANYFGGTGNDLVLQWAGTLPVGWGWNGFGQLGDNTTTDRLVPVATSATGVLAGKTVVSLVSGDGHTLALCSDGTVAAWGKNNFGQLGDNSTTDRLTPVAVTASGVLSGKTVIAIAAGGAHSLALCSDGTVVGWGRNDVGQLGDTTTSHRSVPVVVTNSGVLSGKTVVAIASGSDHSLALCSDGTVAGWGWNGSGNLGDGTTSSRLAPVALTTSGVLSGKTVVAIAAGGGRSLALCSDGTLAAWGENNFGQVGDNSTTNRTTPVAVVTSGVLSGKTVVAIAAGSFHSLALCSDGTLAAWGWNAFGQLGDNTTTDRLSPVAVTTSGVLSGKTIVSLKAGYAFNLALCSDGTLAAWGDNGSGQLGDTTTTSRTTPVAVATSGARSGKTVVGTGAGTYYGLALVATPPPPALTVSAATSVTSTGATLNGTVNPYGTSATLSFAYGLTTSFGSTVAATPSPVSGSSPAAVSASLIGLTPGTTYHYQLTAVTGNGVFTSGNQTFTTPQAAQTITFPNPGTKTLGDAPFALGATASSGLPVSYLVVSGPATLSGGTLTLTGAGTVVVRASQAGDSAYAAATDVEESFTVLTAFDAWRSGRFSSGELAQILVSGPLADPDADGASNLVEYALGAEPRLASDTRLPTRSVSAGRLQLTFARMRGDVTYVVEGSSNLATWSVVAVNPGTVGSFVTVDDTVTMGSNNPSRYLRLRITMP
jgi:alpha-tubulin suppressor-like RCC1 family protein